MQANVIMHARETVQGLRVVHFAASTQHASAVAVAQRIVRLELHSKRREKLTNRLRVPGKVAAATVVRRTTDGVADAAIGRKLCPKANGDV